MANRDVAQARIAIFGQLGRKQRRDPLVGVFQDAFVDGNAHQGGDDRFRGRFDVGRAVGRMAAIAARGDRFAIDGDHHRLQRRQPLRSVEDGLEPVLAHGASRRGEEEKGSNEEESGLDHEFGLGRASGKTKAMAPRRRCLTPK
jgi:hypothetical protein